MVAATMTAMSQGDETAKANSNASSKPAASATPVAAQSDGGRMDAVVDLLFGNHLTEINAGMRALEKQVTERVNKAEAEMRTRVESLDRNTKAEIDSLDKLIEKERSTREDSVMELGDRLDAAIRKVETRLDETGSELTRNHEMMQKDFDERVTKAADATTLLRKNLEQEIASMKISLSTRSELSSMFTDLGKRLEANASGSGLV
jgi:hypothetical protein